MIVTQDMAENDYWSWKYNWSAIQKRLHRVRTGLDFLSSNGIEFDCVIVHGTSGTWLAPLLVELGLRVVMVRKPGENSHGKNVECPASNGQEYERGIVIDDLHASGSTIDRIINLLKEWHEKGVNSSGSWTPHGRPLTVAGVVFYDERDYDRQCGPDGIYLPGPLQIKRWGDSYNERAGIPYVQCREPNSTGNLG